MNVDTSSSQISSKLLLSATQPATKTALTSKDIVSTPGVPPSDKPEPGTQPQAVRDLLGAWGTDNKQFDLNTDGTVDARDLAALLESLRQEPVAPKIGNAHPDVVSHAGDTSNDAPKDVAQSPVDQLLADWGRGDSEFDYNNDGRVGPADLAQLLAKLGQGDEISGDVVTPVVSNVNPAIVSYESAPLGDTEPIADPLGDTPDLGVAPIDNSIGNTPDDSTDDGTVSPLSELLDAWGRGDGRWDLNNDGSVDPRDLAALLESIQSADPDSPLQQLMDAWGSDNARWDYNTDGDVNSMDLAHLLDKLSSNAQPNAAELAPPVAVPQELSNRAPGSRSTGAGSMIDLATHKTSLKSFADKLHGKLEERGFDKTPPRNLGDIISQFNFEATDAKVILDQLQTKYPYGLGVNLEG